MSLRAIPRIASWKYTRLAYALLITAGIFNVIISLAAPIDTTAHWSKTIVYIAEVTIALVQLGIWMIAMRGASGLARYAQQISHASDGRAFQDISRSLLWLIGYIVILPLTSSMADASRGASHNFGLVVLHNYLPLGMILVAVFYMYRGSKRLLALANPITSERWRTVILLLFALAAVFFTWHFIRTVPDLLHDKSLSRFEFSLPVLLLTFVVPHLVAWLVGTLAILNFWDYSTHVEGSIYRNLFRNLYQGIFLVFVCTFIAQVLTASKVELTNMNAGVLVIYFILVIGIAGYLLIYRGIKRLITLESVV